MLDQKLPGRADPQQHRRAAVEPIQQSSPQGSGLIFLHGQGFDIAERAPIQIARSTVVNVVRFAPIAIGKQRHQAEYRADQIIATLAGQKRPMSAIVLDDKQAHVQASRGQRQQQGPAIAPIDTLGHQRPQQQERGEGVQQLPDRARPLRTRKAGAHLAQSGSRDGFNQLAQAKDSGYW